MTVELSVVIPVLNEEHNLRLLLPELHHVLTETVESHEIIVVDGHSDDGTREVAKLFEALVYRQKEKGFGRALWEGITLARGTWILTMDADGSHEPRFIPVLYRQGQAADIVVASRYLPASSVQSPAYRDLLSRVLNRVARHVCSVPLRDLSGGFKLYRRSLFDKITLQARDFNVQLEAVMSAYTLGYRIVEVPYTYRSRREGVSHAKVLAYGWAFAKTLFFLWRRRRELKAFRGAVSSS